MNSLAHYISIIQSFVGEAVNLDKIEQIVDQEEPKSDKIEDLSDNDTADIKRISKLAKRK